MDGWTHGRTDGHMWTQGHPEEGEPASSPVPTPHSGGRGSQGKEVGQGCPLNTEPALGAGPPGRWMPAMAPGYMAALLSPVRPGRSHSERWSYRWDTGSREGKGLHSPLQGAQAVPHLGAGPEPAAALLPDGRAGTGWG